MGVLKVLKVLRVMWDILAGRICFWTDLASVEHSRNIDADWMIAFKTYIGYCLVSYVIGTFHVHFPSSWRWDKVL